MTGVLPPVYIDTNYLHWLREILLLSNHRVKERQRRQALGGRQDYRTALEPAVVGSPAL